jgi:hypothetical protein
MAKARFYTRYGSARGGLPKMKIVVVGGHTRNIGKTSVVVGLIHGLPSLDWTAVKISPHSHAAELLPGDADAREGTEPAFLLLTEEESPAAPAETSRSLAAGARRALWLRVQESRLAEACGRLLDALQGAGCVIIESNRVLESVKPSVCLMVLDSSRPDFKSSAQRFLHRADAPVLIGSHAHATAWPAISVHLLERKPTFPARALGEVSPGLCEFVWQKLHEPGVDNPLSQLFNSSPAKEQPWRH